MHSDLENLSTLVNFSMIKSGDGSYNVYLGGQTPLVLGSQTLQISAGFSSGQTADSGFAVERHHLPDHRRLARRHDHG